jgi:hypothetical protein
MMVTGFWFEYGEDRFVVVSGDGELWESASFDVMG